MNDAHPNAPGNNHTTDDWSDKEARENLPAVMEPTLSTEIAQIEISQMVATARRYPRSIDTALGRLKAMVLYDEAAAENSVYALVRGTKPVVGPSIGFANCLATAWGNCWDYSQMLGTDRREKVVVARGVFVDWETNRTMKQDVQRRISDRNGRIYNDDMIVVTSMAAQQIARRNAILNAIPRPIWFPMFEKCVFVVKGTEKTLPEKREKAIHALAHFGIDVGKILLFLQVKEVKEISVEHLPTLRAMYTQLRDGSVTPEEMFDPRSMLGGSFEQIENPLGPEEHVDPGTGEVTAAKPAAPAGTAGAQEAKPAAPVAEVKPTPAKEPAAETAGAQEAGAKGGKGSRKTREKVDPPPADPPAATAAPAQAAPADPPAGPAAEEAKPAAAAPAPEVFPTPYAAQTAATYAEYAKRWIAREETTASARKRWTEERSIRNGLRDTLDEAQLAMLQAEMAKVGKVEAVQ